MVVTVVSCLTQYGFALPAHWIRPVAAETAKMVEYLANFVAEKEKFGKAEA